MSEHHADVIASRQRETRDKDLRTITTGVSMNANSGGTPMRMTTLTLASSFVFAFATAAIADESTLTPQPEQMAQPISAVANDSNQVICHHLMHEGALMNQQVCLTKRAWERVRLQTQKTVSDIEVRSYSAPRK